MKIVHAAVHSLAIPLTVPYTIAYVTITDTVNHFLVIETDTGVKGIGCAAPAPDVTGETPEMSLAALHHLLGRISNADVSDEAFWSSTLSAMKSTPSAMTALDMALADVSSRAAHQSCLEWMGGSNLNLRPVSTSVTIGISSFDETLERARLLVSQGIHFVKVKGGHSVDQDIERLTGLRNEFGPDIMLALDANQGYSPSQVERLEKHNATLDLRYLEQPTSKRDLSLLADAAKATSIPVMADEAVQTLDDAKRIADLGVVRFINIKLQKMGGLLASSRIEAIASAAGMQTMLGCMDESALSINAALLFGAAHPSVVYYDLDGHLDLATDPFETLVTMNAGKLTSANGLGLGWTSFPLFANGN
ncbi:MAG: dipeptide epimerase [Bacteroidetes bacterium]|nr:dipeptide epimerase [Bacteroidota bacterium]